MNKPVLIDADKELNRTGYAHIAFSVGSKEAVSEVKSLIKKSVGSVWEEYIRSQSVMIQKLIEII